MNNYSNELQNIVDGMVEKLEEKILNSLIEKMKHNTIFVDEDSSLITMLDNEKIYDNTLQVVVSGIEQAKNRNFNPLFDDSGQLIAIDFIDDKVYKGQAVHIRYIAK